MTGNQIRKVMLELIDEYSNRGPGYFQSGTILREVGNRLNIGNDLETQQAILTFWNDLFRSGHLAWGYDLSNIEPPFCHITEQGRKTLEHYSRDPVNPDGYFAHLNTIVDLPQITISYLKEAVNSYNSNCFKACAVMIGCASESIILKLRDTLVEKMNTLGKTKPQKLGDWRVKRVIDSIENELNKVKSSITIDLYEKFNAYWPALVHQIRTVRNDAGHPKNINSITQENVHASLLIFPELAKMTSEIEEWIESSYA